MTLKAFVTQHYGSQTAIRMKRINTGGSSNQKGSLFEDYFAISKICELASDSSSDLSKILISSQEEGFVDDLCIRDDSFLSKTNYQAKNSAGAAADWTDDITNRFMMQKHIDISFHQYPTSLQILLTSCKEKRNENEVKIPTDMTDYAFSEHFPYCDNNYELITRYDPLRSNLQKLTGQTRLDQLDYAFKLLLGAWKSTVNGRSVQQILDSVECEGKPSCFKKSMLQINNVPEWLTSLIHDIPALQGVGIGVESTRVKVSFNGMEVSAKVTSLETEPDQNELHRLTDPLQLIHFVIKRAQAELN